MPSVEGLESRRAALRLLDAVLRQGRTLEAAAQKGIGLPAPDQALAVAIAGEVLRRAPALDALIDGSTRQNLPPDSKARMVLRMALAQKMGLETPDHAIVATALPLVDGGPRRLVHGVLGNLLRRGLPSQDWVPLPEAVELRWREAWGEDVVEAARRQILVRPPLDLSFKVDAAAQAFADDHDAICLADRHVRLVSSPVEALPDFGRGDWWVQNLAASLPARLIPDAARQVLDLCAAPGGKTMQMAAAGHSVTSLDLSEDRLTRLRENLSRTGLDAQLVVADLLRWKPKELADAILLDAPCSATGTFRRHPEVLYRASARSIGESADLQRRMLERAAEWLRPGGTLVYSVCSLEPEEGEKVAHAFLQGHADFRIDPPGAGALPDFATPSDGWVRILPGMLEQQGGLDGFFIARLVRSGG